MATFQDVMDPARFLVLDSLPAVNDKGKPEDEQGKTRARVFFQERKSMIPVGYTLVGNRLLFDGQIGYRRVQDETTG